MRRITIALLFAVGVITLAPETADAQILPWRRNGRTLFGRPIRGSASTSTGAMVGAPMMGGVGLGTSMDGSLSAPGIGIGTGTNVGVGAYGAGYGNMPAGT